MAPSWISQLTRHGRLPGDHRVAHDNAAARFNKHDFAQKGEKCRSRRFPVCSVGVMLARPASNGFPPKFAGRLALPVASLFGVSCIEIVCYGSSMVLDVTGVRHLLGAPSE